VGVFVSQESWGKLPTFFDYVDEKEFKMEHRPVLTVDAIVTRIIGGKSKFLLIKRKNPPHGWALAGGLVDCGETTEQAVVRELKEETSLDSSANKVLLFEVRSKPDRDPRFHAISLVYEILDFAGEPRAADDAKELSWFTYDEIQELEMAFDHKEIIQSWQGYVKEYGAWKDSWPIPSDVDKEKAW
jgi:ADP-ribose pyrophosphatase YjhB (NUDIX family)